MKPLRVLGAALTILLSAGACAGAPPDGTLAPTEATVAPATGPSPSVAGGWHEDGDGPLRTQGGPGFDGAAVDPREGGGAWTFAVSLCMLDPTVPATLQSVEATASVGSYQLLGMLVRTFVPRGDDNLLTTVVGFPPRVPDPLRAVAGHVVPNGCLAGDAAPYTELLIGLGLKGPEGGGFDGIDITYKAGGLTWTLHSDAALLICGPAVAEIC